MCDGLRGPALPSVTLRRADCGDRVRYKTCVDQMKTSFAAISIAILSSAWLPSHAATEATLEDWCLRVDDRVANDEGIEGVVISSHCDPQDETYEVLYEGGARVWYYWSELLDRRDQMPKLISRISKSYDVLHGRSGGTK